MYNGELIVDLFAGGGGASTGIEMALGVSPDVAVNHDPQAIALHEANHPKTKHFIEDVFDVDPKTVCDGKKVGLLWMSPDCKHFSKAKGSKPVSCDIRSLAWIGVKWAKEVEPRVLILENVEEFKTWGPLDENDMPIKERKGETFREFVGVLEQLGYTVEWNELRASDYGAPTIRKRLFLIARRDGEQIVWPEPTHGDPKKRPDLKEWKTAADCVDWDIPAHSIFLTKEEGKKAGVRRPLAENTMKRLARGLRKFVIENENPYVVTDKVPFVSTFYGGGPGNDNPRGNYMDAPVGTITAGGSRHALVLPYVTEHANGSSPRSMPIDGPMRTVMASVKGGHFALVNAFIAQHNLGATGRVADSPMATVTTTGSQQQLVASSMIKFRGTNTGDRIDSPMHTITAGGTHMGEMRAFMMKYYGTGEGQDINDPAHTVTTKERFALVKVQGTLYEIIDIAMRMFTPRELYRAQGFPETYKINIMYNNKPLPKTAQVRMCGNSVVPLLAQVLVESNFAMVEAEVIT